MLVIDQQADFHPGGSLAIPTANEDAQRIAAFIRKHSAKLQQLVLTLDSHQRYHVAHGVFWENAKGESPAPFTLITAKDVAADVWRPRDASLKSYVLAYTSTLEASGKFTLCIWPEHCLIGSPGHNIVPNVLAAALDWTKQSLKPVQFVMKGSNSLTEHYSALKAEFELPYDPATRYRTAPFKREWIIGLVRGSHECYVFAVQPEPVAGGFPQVRRQGGRVWRGHLALRELHGARLGGCVAQGETSRSGDPHGLRVPRAGL
jgi:nicotinamidase/pyrazinamidase